MLGSSYPFYQPTLREQLDSESFASQQGSVSNATVQWMRTVTIGTYNVRHAVLDDDEYTWDQRREGVVERIEQASPEIVGLQECTGDQHAELARMIPGYDFVGVADNPGSGEHNPIGYGPDWDCEDSETIWLSESGVPESVGWDAAYPRVLTRATFRNRADDRRLTVLNTHFDHIGRQARLESARSARNEVDAVPGEQPAILLGDFNTEPGAPAYTKLLANDYQRSLRDARAVAEQVAGPATTLTDFESLRPDRQVDHIFVTAGWAVSEYRVDATKTNGQYPSDHLPVIITADY